ncbi:glycosyltransferase [Salinibacter ruber]|uniref:Glycosyltransferase involved in cell wall biosynthesis n=2 Tax=Salinibacter ruber TaxID=146919 RepID=A0A9X2TF78_9BACT|nr:glycosyltransferase [Salinibacter ruber]MCS3678764.1 glycosyltransferase involved in cell wall biosynthesis [Salinibacter ruber]
MAANTRWVYALAEALAREAPVHVTRMYDWRTYWSNQPSWPEPDPAAVLNLERTQRVLPTGYAGQLEWLARPFMRWMIDGWRQELREESREEPVVVAPYPYLAPWVRSVPRNRLVYYNLDAYRLYRPERAEWIRKREEELVEQAGLTICLAQTQVEALKDRHPAQANRIEHFPLGVLDSFLNPHPDRDPDPGTIGYVGNLSDRVDWKLVRSVVEECSDLQFVFAGGLDEIETGGEKSAWRKHRAAAFQQPNVEHLGRIPQDDVTELYWNCAVNWIPYDTDHPFNQAACPTKIMDGIASGRPVVSTPVPECELYSAWITTVDESDKLGQILRQRAKNSTAHSIERQIKFARKHTWNQRASTLRAMLDVRSDSKTYV